MGTMEQIQALKERMQQSIIGQEAVIDRLLIGLLANGNLLLEGLPGLAKTRAVKALAKNMECDYSRIQFTPDLLPADVTGTEMYFQSDTGGQFKFQPGPIFANIVLADEINRAPAKVQAALLEAMEERQVTVAGTTHKMAPLFMVLATQNPVEQEGTYPLPEAQMDRFLMHVRIEYPPLADEIEVIRLVRREEQAALMAQTEEGGAEAPRPPIAQDVVFDARREIAALHCAEAMETYMATIVQATRTPAEFGDTLAKWIEIGASPRASLALDRCARTHAWLAGRDYVDPEDVRAIAPDVLRHRLALSYEAQGTGVSADQVVAEVLAQVALP
ncbi:AAA family ATPase [Shimia marina]|uniref:Magnesium chelatase ATPase subunit D n=1 Tax=Shimia marina TaxID=321267 RepID=A0A0P1EUL5_9RHOB|nr:MoxR family ATPase [Shimia marina]CUH54363.1 magnesium chelatase ATPase subunit D [Shimia marina]SFE01675.1 MoxR-like ATPase [Shimia marina]